MTDDPIQLAYAAGVIDGEGYFGASVRKSTGRAEIRLNVTQCGPIDRPPQILVRLCEIFGVGNFYYSGIKIATNRFPHQYEFRVWKYDDVHMILRAVWPYLGRVKRRQAVRALRAHRAARAVKPLPVTR